MTPDQIETMRKIARADFIAQDDYEPGSAPEWAIEGFRPVIREGRWAIRLTEAGAEVLRLWEGRERAKRERDVATETSHLYQTTARERGNEITRLERRAIQDHYAITRAESELEAIRVRSTKACEGTGLAPANASVVPEIVDILTKRLKTAEQKLAEAKRERLEVGLRAGFDVGALEEERETALCAQHDRFEGLLAAALGDPPIVDLDGDEPDLPDLESLIKAVERMRFALAAERAAHAETLLVLAAAPLVADAAVIGGPEVSAKTVAATVHDGLRRLHENLQTERRRNVAIEEEGGAESILSDLGALLDARVGWFEGEGTVEHVRRALDERDSLRAAHAETLLVLAAEQGRQEGAPPGWGRTSWLWQRCIGGPPITTLEVTRASTHPEDKPWHWRIFRPALIAEGYAATARAAMLAADSFSPPSGGRTERDSPPK